ncbi:AAA family ATPase [Brevundimonas sp.]|uniref:AAA family ATPase n=1 Tax=Brevundimonas sp. TaxID=1871086 RepID=UPI003565161D
MNVAKGLRSTAVTPAAVVASDPTSSRFIDLMAWVDREPPDRDWLIPDLIPAGCVTALYGDGGSGKTMLALDLMVAMASRQKLWLGQLPRGWRSVGLFAEDDGDELVRRLRRICDARGVPFDQIAPYISALPGVGLDTILALYAETGELVLTALMHDLLERVKSEGASLLVIDYAAAVFGGNELDRHQVSDFMRKLNACARQQDIAILLLGHPSVDGMKGGRGTSGSTAWRNQARSFLHLIVDDVQGDPDKRCLLTLKHTKSNYGRAGRTYNLASDGSRFDILEAPVRRAKGLRLSPAQTIAMTALKKATSEAGAPSPGGPVPLDAAGTTLTLWREYSYSMGISPTDNGEARKRAFSRAVKDLQSKGVVGTHGPFAWVIETEQ